MRLTSSGLWSYAGGYVIIKVTGGNTEEFLNLVGRLGIHMWGIRRVGAETLLAQLRTGEFRRLRVVARRSRCRVHILRRRGVLFTWRRVMRRRVLVAGFVAIIVVFYLAGQYIWFIRLDGVSVAERARAILSAADRAGLRVGAQRRAVNLERVAREVLTEVPGLAWAGVELRGTVASVRVVEKALKPAQSASARHLVATVPGLVRSVVTIRGLPLVQPGETVKAGQILISGVVPEVMASAAGIGTVAAAGGNLYVEAEGIITAKVWYEVANSVPFREVTYKRSGRWRQALGFTVGNLSWWPRGREPGKAFAHRESEAADKQLRLGVFTLPATLHRQMDFELVPEVTVWTQVEAERESRRRAAAEMRKLLPANFDLVGERFTIKKTSSPERVEGSLVYEVLQNIAQPAGVSVGEPPPPEIQPPPAPQPTG